MSLPAIHFWKKTPFLKIIIPLMGGIMVQWQFNCSALCSGAFLAASILLLLSFSIMPVRYRHRLIFFTGIAVSAAFFFIGALLTRHNDIRNDNQWFGTQYNEKDGIIVRLTEPVSSKTNSFKANAQLIALSRNDSVIPAKGNIILYLQKRKTTDSVPALGYGSVIIIKKPLQEIKNSGNPGGFDYKRYCLFQGITHQVFLKKNEYEQLPGKIQTWLGRSLYSSRDAVLNILRKNIKGEKELGLAEALLIGYKDDLGQALVQSYTNTGVVHIIAISGLHLGLVYWLFTLLFKPLKKNKKLNWLRALLIIAGLWAFSLLAGAQPSVLRSALMFSCIVLGESFDRKTSVYNSLAASAFLLLCYDPFWLWDVGFQLSYAAVLSIVIFFRPVYNLFYIKNKLLDHIWKLNAVTLAAQVLTIPISIYHFHQFPNYFLLTNFIAVPLSSLIVLGEIFLCIIGFIPLIASITGKILAWLIWLMNTYIERIEHIPYALQDGLQISLLQAITLVIFISAIAFWLIEKKMLAFKISLTFLLLFICLRSLSFIHSNRQQKIIVYNVPGKSAIDLINGRHFTFIGDSELRAKDFARNFHLKPCRILHRINEVKNLNGLINSDNYSDFLGKHILLLDKPVSFIQRPVKPVIDLLVISKNPVLYINKLAASLAIKQIIVDGSVPAYKAKKWKNDCDSMHIPFYNTSMQGAFVMTLN
jgi:competence protein ComEC